MLTGVTSMTPANAGGAVKSAAAIALAKGTTAILTIRFMTNLDAFPG
jgi:hypothetical protein